MTLQNFIEKWDGEYCEVAGSANAKNQCVDLANAYIRDVLGLPIIEWTNACDFPKKWAYEVIKNTTDAIPLEGDLIIWSNNIGGGAGHIAIFLEGNKYRFTSFDQNYPLYSPCHAQGHTYSNVSYFLRYNKPVEDTMTDQQKKALEALQILVDNGTYGNVESAGRALVDLVRDVKEYKKHIEAQEEANLALALQVEKEQANVKTLSDSIIEKDEAFRIATAEIGKKNLQITEMQNIIDSYQTTPPTANKPPEKPPVLPPQKDNLLVKIWLLISKLWQPKK